MAKTWMVTKIGSDPRYWVDFFDTQKEVIDFLADQRKSFPDKYSYRVSKIVPESELNSFDHTTPCCGIQLKEEIDMAEFAGYTVDCHCGKILIIVESHLEDFNVHVNAKDPRWPADGSNTGYIEV